MKAIGIGVAVLGCLWISRAKADDARLAHARFVEGRGPGCPREHASRRQEAFRQGRRRQEGRQSARSDRKAFALPHGVSANGFNDKQRKAYNDLKKRYTPKLKDYLERIAKAHEEKDKNIAAKEMLVCVKDIRGEIDKILNMPAQEAAKKAAQRAKQAKQAEQARKKAAEQAKKWRRTH